MDCEYNRLDDDLKKLSDNGNVRPDIVVHKRGCKGSNELVVEVKKSNTVAQIHDEDKLKEFTGVQGDYGYRLGFVFGVWCSRPEWDKTRQMLPRRREDQTMLLLWEFNG